MKPDAIAKRDNSSEEEETNQHESLNALQRAVSLTTGAVMLIKAVRNRSILRGIGAGYLIYRGATGTCPVSEIIGQDVMDLNPLRA